jgi:hypothetical protein
MGSYWQWVLQGVLSSSVKITVEDRNFHSFLKGHLEPPGFLESVVSRHYFLQHEAETFMVCMNELTSLSCTWIQARGLLQKGDIQSILDPALSSNYRLEAVWKLAELALRSVEPYGRYRPTMSEIVLELTEIIQVERHDSLTTDSDSDSFGGPSLIKSRTHSPSTSYAFDSSSIAPLHSGSLDDEYKEPSLR